MKKNSDNDVKFFERSVYKTDKQNGKRNRIGVIAVFVVGTLSANPKGLLDRAVKQYVAQNRFAQFAQNGFGQFTEIHLDNPWCRIVTIGFNDFPFKKYNQLPPPKGRGLRKGV